MASRAGRRGRAARDADLRRLRQGCDALSTDRPLRLVLCVADDAAFLWARRCALRAGAVVVGIADGRRDIGLAERAATLRELEPDALLVVGDRGRARPLATIVEAAVAASAGASGPTPVACAGDNALQAEIQHATAAALPFIRAQAPSRDRAASAVERLRALRRRDAPLVLEHLEARTRALGALDVLACELAGGSTRLAYGSADAILGIELPLIGIDEGGDALVRRSGPEAVRRWLVLPVDPAAVWDRLANAARRGPLGSAVGAALRLALAREALRAAGEDARALLDAKALARPRTVVLHGALAELPGAAGVAAILDGLQVFGAFRVLAGAAPLALVVAEPADRGPLAVRVRDEGGEREERVGPGELAWIAAKGRTSVRAGRVAIEGEGGTLGVVVDARPRPLRLPERDGERLPLVASWTRALELPA